MTKKKKDDVQEIKDNIDVKVDNEVKNISEKTNRFFTVNDDKSDTFLIKINPGWWSRPYEYLWASQFVNKKDTVLDTACGLSHPFKYLLASLCDDVSACDIDSRVTNKNKIIHEMKKEHGENNFVEFERNYPDILDKVYITQADLLTLPYLNESFDVTFCISTLEHLNSKEEIKQALKELSRVTKPDGKIIITIDVPTIDIKEFVSIVKDSKLKFSGEVDTNIPDNAINQDYLGVNLKVFRCVLIK